MTNKLVVSPMGIAALVFTAVLGLGGCWNRTLSGPDNVIAVTSCNQMGLVVIVEDGEVTLVDKDSHKGYESPADFERLEKSAKKFSRYDFPCG